LGDREVDVIVDKLGEEGGKAEVPYVKLVDGVSEK
jgi:hypothetical protein